LRRELTEIGLSESVIQTAEQGLYTTEQLEKLKAMKLETKQAIELSIEGARTNAMAAQLADSVANGPSNHDGTAASTPATIPVRLMGYTAFRGPTS
jgi:hypothetical protein